MEHQNSPLFRIPFLLAKSSFGQATPNEEKTESPIIRASTENETSESLLFRIESKLSTAAEYSLTALSYSSELVA